MLDLDFIGKRHSENIKLAFDDQINTNRECLYFSLVFLVPFTAAVNKNLDACHSVLCGYANP